MFDAPRARIDEEELLQALGGHEEPAVQQREEAVRASPFRQLDRARLDVLVEIEERDRAAGFLPVAVVRDGGEPSAGEDGDLVRAVAHGDRREGLPGGGIENRSGVVRLVQDDQPFGAGSGKRGGEGGESQEERRFPAHRRSPPGRLYCSGRDLRRRTRRDPPHRSSTMNAA
jgi:hypothetical protein